MCGVEGAEEEINYNLSFLRVLNNFVVIIFRLLRMDDDDNDDDNRTALLSWSHYSRNLFAYYYSLW